MRLICTLVDKSGQLLGFSHFLKSKGIENYIEEYTSAVGLGATSQLWITDEDRVEEAFTLYEEYKKDPEHIRYKVITPPPSQNSRPTSLPKQRSIWPTSWGPVTLTLLIGTVLLFFWGQFQREDVSPPTPKSILQAPLFGSIDRTLLYDYPAYFELRDHLYTLWTPEEIKEKKPPNKAALSLLRTIEQQEVWMGIYPRILEHRRNPLYPLGYEGPMFEKIKQKELWRIVTPAFLHFDFIHIFFNILWFIILANQIEKRIGSMRTLFLIIAAAAVSNTAQYLMSGPFFLGLSGVVCALAAFIWARQQKAPWEGYLLHRTTLIFLAVFVLGMFLLSFAFFILQYFFGMEISAVIANTAHIAGALVGYLLGRSRLFASHL